MEKRKLMQNPWNKLSASEQAELWELIKRVNRWTKYCAMMRAMKPPMEPDMWLDLSNEEYLRWDALSQKMWK